MLDLAIYSRDVGVAQRKLEPLEVPEVVRPPGEHLRETGPSANRALRRLTSLEMLRPQPEPLPDGSSFCEDDAQLAHRVAQARDLAGWLASQAGPLVAAEAEQASKAVLQRGGAPGWFVIEGGLVNERDAPGFDEGMLAVRGHLLDLPAYKLPRRYKRGTSHSWPTYRTTDTSLIIHALMAASARNFDELQRIGYQVAEILGEIKTPMSAQMYTRTGAIRKAQSVIEVRGDGAYKLGQATGIAPRRRVVYGMPSCGNIWQLQFLDPIKSRMTASPWLWHFGADDVARKAHKYGANMKWYSDDLSGYDQSVSVAHQEAYLTIIAEPLAGRQYAEFVREWKDIPLLGPPLRSGDAAFLYRKHGMTASGTLTTALEGSIINAARIFIAAARAMGVTVAQAARTLGRNWAFFCQGDDTLIGFGVAHDIAKYVTASEELGFSTKLLDGAVFLMNHILPERRGGVAFALASRVFQQTIFNEYGGESLVQELAAYVARAARATANPFYPQVERLVLQDSALAEFAGGTTFAVLRRRLAEPAIQLELAALVRAKPRLRGVVHQAPPAAISALVAGLMQDPTVTLPLPEGDWDNAQRRAFAEDARRLAAWSAIRKEERGHAPALETIDYTTALLHLRGEEDDDNAEAA